MGELYYPTLDLFIYDIKAPLNLDAKTVEQNTQNFRNKLPPDIQFRDDERQEYCWQLTEPKKPRLPADNPNLEDLRFYPVRLHDVYGLQIDCSVKNLSDPQFIDESFPLIKKEIQQKAKPDKNTFGQTWLISGWLTEDHYLDPETLANSCYESVSDKSNSQQDLYGKGTFLEGHIFEYWQSQSYPENHVIIILFPNREMAEKGANKFYTEWLLLFCFYHKITWAYHQSRLINKTLANHYKKVDEYARNLKDTSVAPPSIAKSLSNIQEILNQYTIDLLNLAFQKQTITTNLINYQSRVVEIKQKAGEASQLDFMDKFSDLVQKKYLIQIDKDSDNMQLGLKLLENNLNAIRSRIDLEKAEHDRTFQKLVTIVGTGTAIATLLDFEGKKCKAILSVPKDAVDSICDNFWVGGIGVPLGLLIILGGCGWVIKKLVFDRS